VTSEEALAAVEVSRAQFGEDHVGTLDKMRDLAIAYIEEGRASEAGALARSLLATREMLFANDDYEIQQLLLILSLAISNEGDLAGARLLQEGVLEEYDRMFGPDSPSAVIAGRHLSETLRLQEDHSALLLVEDRILSTRLRTLGEVHPDTVLAMRLLAQTNRALNRFLEARDLDQRAIEIIERTAMGDRLAIEVRCDLFLDLKGLNDGDGMLMVLKRLYDDTSRLLSKNDPLRKRVERHKPLMKVLLRTSKAQRGDAGGIQAGA
jgi:Mg2+ and Co2+ transporter CorA